MGKSCCGAKSLPSALELLRVRLLSTPKREALYGKSGTYYGERQQHDLMYIRREDFDETRFREESADENTLPITADPFRVR